MRAHPPPPSLPSLPSPSGQLISTSLPEPGSLENSCSNLPRELVSAKRCPTERVEFYPHGLQPANQEDADIPPRALGLGKGLGLVCVLTDRANLIGQVTQMMTCKP